MWTLGVGVDYLVKAGLGWSFKHIESSLAPRGDPSVQRGEGKAEANAHDFGMVAHLPIDEAGQLLVRVEPGGKVHYAKFLGDINFWDHVFSGKSGDETVITKKGWEVGLLEIFSYRRGRHEDALGYVYYDTEGIGVHLTGALKAIGYLNPQLKNSAVFDFLANHFDIQYNTSNLEAGEGHPLSETKFHGISVSVF